MDLGDAAATERVGDTRTAGAILGPALLLWCIVAGMLGGYGLLANWLVAWLPGDSVVFVGLYEGIHVVLAVLIGVRAWRDRSACRVLARPRPGMAELCVVLGSAGALLLAALERTIPDGSWPEDALRAWPLALHLLMTAVVAGVSEELLFRGILLQRLRKVVTLRIALATQAMLFAIVHFDMVMLLPHFLFGLLAGVLRVAARALWPCLLLHVAWNGWFVLAARGVV